MLPGQGGGAAIAVNTVEPRGARRHQLRDGLPRPSPIEAKGAVAAGPAVRNVPHVRVGRPVPLPRPIGAPMPPQGRLDATVLAPRVPGGQCAGLGGVLAQLAVAAAVPVLVGRRIGLTRPSPVNNLGPLGPTEAIPLRPPHVPRAVPRPKGVPARVAATGPIIPTHVLPSAKALLRATLEVTPPLPGVHVALMPRRHVPLGPIRPEVVATSLVVTVRRPAEVLATTQEPSAAVRVTPVGVRAAAGGAPRVIREVREPRAQLKATVVRQLTAATRRVGSEPSLRVRDVAGGPATVAGGVLQGRVTPPLRARVERARPVPRATRPAPVTRVGPKPMAASAGGSELPRRAATTPRPRRVGAVRRLLQPSGACGLLVAAQPSRAPLVAPGLPIGAVRARGRVLAASARGTLAAVRTAARGVGRPPSVAATMAAPGVAGPLAAPLLVEAANAVRVLPPADGKGLRATVPTGATARLLPAAPGGEEADEVGANLGEEVVEAGPDGGLPDALGAPEGVPGAGRASIGGPQGRAALVAGPVGLGQDAPARHGARAVGVPGALLQRGLPDAQEGEASGIAVVGFAPAEGVAAAGQEAAPAGRGTEGRAGPVREEAAAAAGRGVPSALAAAVPVREVPAAARGQVHAVKAATDGEPAVAPADAVRVAVPPHGAVPGATGPALLRVHGRVRAVRVAARPTIAPTALVPVVEAAAAVGVAPEGLIRLEGEVVPAGGPIRRFAAKRHALAGLAPSETTPCSAPIAGAAPAARPPLLGAGPGPGRAPATETVPVLTAGLAPPYRTVVRRNASGLSCGTRRTRVARKSATGPSGGPNRRTQRRCNRSCAGRTP